MSLKVVKRPFRTGGKVYSAGEIVDPADITLFKNKMREGKIIMVDEHNLDEVATYLKHRYNIEGAYDKLKLALDPPKEPKEPAKDPVDEEYVAKVKVAAKKHKVKFAGRPLEDVVAEVKEKQKAAKKG